VEGWQYGPAPHGSAEGGRWLGLRELVWACEEENRRRLRGETHRDDFSRELFRRAICERDAAAWESLFTLYRGLVASWVRQHPASDSVSERDDCVNLVFERFWVAALLKYLKMCVHTVLIDEVRARRVAQQSLAAWPAEETLTATTDVGAVAAARLADDELWDLVSREVTDEAERLLLYLTAGLDLSPRQIHARYPRVFSSIRDVYRIKRNVLDRLRRNQAVRRHLAPV